MDKLLSKEIYLAYTSRIRGRKEGFYTNFFWSDKVHPLWIAQQELTYCELSERTVLFFRKNEGFKNLYYLTADWADLQQLLMNYLSQEADTLVCDLVGREKDLTGAREIFHACGFKERRLLQRMVKVGTVEMDCPPFDSHIVPATGQDLFAVSALLKAHFDKLSEQLPSHQELLDWVKEESIFLYKEGNQIGGFIIFDNQGVSLTLRYWFVHPDYRNRHIGSQLYQAMMWAGRASKRQMHWVVSDNENAIVRYQHFGYQFDNLMDVVFVKEQILPPPTL
jgi:GNAT superfamily N-acetyltransferase